MKNSVWKRIIAVVLCLVVFAGSELTGLTNIVGDLFASENPEIGMEADEPAEETEEIVLSEEESEPEEEPVADAPELEEEPAADLPEETPADEAQLEEAEDVIAEAAQDSVEEAPADTEGEDGPASVTDTKGEEESGNQDGEKLQDEEADSQETETPAETIEDKEDETSDGEAAEGENPVDTEDGEETTVPDEEEDVEEDEEEPEAFDEEYKDGQVIIRAGAEPGVVPNGTELSVKKIVQQDVETLDDEDEIREAEELNAKYEDIKSELELTVADDDTKEIAGFVAYDVSFLLTDENGETEKIEPDGDVSVFMEFEEAYLPEEIAEKADQIDIDSIDVIHMEEAGQEESETGLKSEVVADADVSTTENAVEKAEFTTDSGKTFVITWTENDLGEREYVCETEDATIKVTAAKGVIPDGALLKVVPILADNKATQKQYQDVEKKLLEKAESEEYEIAGFLAYDIFFTDEAGTKLEPNGEVKVAIDYKKAAIPEDLKELTSTTRALNESEDAEEDDAEQTGSAVSDATAEAPEEAEETVLTESGKEDETSESSNSQSGSAAPIGSITVMHLEENDQGQVTKVVDMGAEGKVTALNSTKNQEVTSTEFVTESFSAFTIVWTSGGIQNSIRIEFYDIADNEKVQQLILKPLEKFNDETWGTVELKVGESFYISEVREGGSKEAYYQLKDQNDNLYTFVKAEAYFTFGGNMQGMGEITAFRLTETGLKCDTQFGGPQGNYNNMAFHFYYGRNLETVDTIDNNDYGITMRMINYDEHYLQDNLMGVPTQNDGWWNEQGATQGIVRRRLEDGYPVMTTEEEGGLHGANGGSNLALLFGGVKNDSRVEITEANGLFLKSKYEKDGYFEYSSFQNYAYMNGNGQFTVYKGIGATEYGRDEYFPFYRGNFFPYNDITSGEFTDKNFNKYGTGREEELPDNDDRKGEKLYLVKNPDYCFGMYLEAAFAQPQGGMVEHNGEKSSMEYKFTGDDDLWIFIDDSLVLDIGGAHHACSGSVNFSTGVVEVDGKTPSTIKEMFKKSGYFPDGSEWDESKADFYFDGNTFKDYSTHRIKMFYMEHGKTAIDNASNLQVKMNLPTVPEGTVEIEKQLSNTDKEKYKDVEFAFQVFAQKIDQPGSAGKAETYIEDKYITLTSPVDKETGKPIKTENKTINGKVYENVFYLKPGQVAQFKNLQDNREYYVKEIDVKSSEYDKVTITGSTIENHDNNGGTTVSSDIESVKKTVGERPRVVYINECSAQNSRKLRITKQMELGQSPVDSSDTFTFKVSLGGKPYDGQYVLIKSDGTKSEKRQATSNGEISGVSVGDTVEIDQIMSGTTFKVEEVLDEEKYTLAGIKGKDETYEAVDNTESDSKALNGKIVLGKDAEVMVTNALQNAETSRLTITKKLKGSSSDTSTSFDFEILWMQNNEFKPYEGTYSVEGRTETAANGKISIKAGETAVIEMPNAMQFQVKEILSPGYGTPEIMVTGTAADSEIKGNTVTGTVLKGQYADISVTNIPAYSYNWQIVKKGTEANSKPLEGAEFTLTSKPLQGEQAKVYYGKSQKDSGVIQWFKDSSYEEEVNDIAPGEYELAETKAPIGYVLSNTSWTIKLEYKNIQVNDGKVKPTDSSKKMQDGNVIYEYTFLNEAVYELPSTGGIGIHWYMVSGTLMMMLGILILYKRKYAGRC